MDGGALPRRVDTADDDGPGAPPPPASRRSSDGRLTTPTHRPRHVRRHPAPLARNLTPDRTTGIGTRDEERFITALVTGRRPDGTTVDTTHMPIPMTRAMTDTERRAIWRYLRTVAARRMGEWQETDGRVERGERRPSGTPVVASRGPSLSPLPSPLSRS